MISRSRVKCFVFVLLSLFAANGISVLFAAEPLAKLKPVDFRRITPELFADDELDLPYYLANFARLADSVRSEGKSRGFIDIHVWRKAEDNKPHNARIMENILSLAFFYCTDRPWNPYYKDERLRARLEAALTFWCDSQAEDGRFSEYSPRGWGLAPTAFATKFMGETLRLLAQGPPIDPALHQRVIDTDRKAIEYVLDSTAYYNTGKRVSNQYTNVWAGGFAFLALYPDSGLEEKLLDRVRRNHKEYQSPVGFFYEANGPDWSYNLGTHLSNEMMSYRETKNPEVRRLILDEIEKFYDWVSYNAVLEPDRTCFVLNRGVESRSHMGVHRIARLFTQLQQKPGSFWETNLGVPFTESIEIVRAFSPTKEEMRDDAQKVRKEWEQHWGDAIPRLVLDKNGFVPYIFLHRTDYRWYPSHEEKEAAIRKLPYFAKSRFTHQRTDSRNPLTYTFFRRGPYYAAFNSGKILTKTQRYGLGLVFLPECGTILQSQSRSDDAAFGTKPEGAQQVYEASDLPCTFLCDGKEIPTEPGVHDLPNGDWEIRYRLGEHGRKSIRFLEDRIVVQIDHPGAFTEILPLMKYANDSWNLRNESRSLDWTRSGTAGKIRLLSDAPFTVSKTTYPLADREIVPVELRGKNQLRYEITFAGKK